MLTQNHSWEALEAQPREQSWGEGGEHSFGTYLLSASSMHLAQREVTVGVAPLTVSGTP